jgi:hypothetical protein
MDKSKFESLIQGITKREFYINTTDKELEAGKKYSIFKILPISQRKVWFDWTTPKKEDNFLRSFITTFTTKYKEPNPKAYSGMYRSRRWEDMNDKEKEFAYMHHKSNMYSKKDLLQQVEDNFKSSDITNILCRYGFYPTNYGIGIFCFYATNAVMEAIIKMKKHLQDKSIPYTNGFSDAKWVLRFKLNLSKEAHKNIIAEFNKA